MIKNIFCQIKTVQKTNIKNIYFSQNLGPGHGNIQKKIEKPPVNVTKNESTNWSGLALAMAMAVIRPEHSEGAGNHDVFF